MNCDTILYLMVLKFLFKRCLSSTNDRESLDTYSTNYSPRMTYDRWLCVTRRYFIYVNVLLQCNVYSVNVPTEDNEYFLWLCSSILLKSISKVLLQPGFLKAAIFYNHTTWRDKRVNNSKLNVEGVV